MDGIKPVNIKWAKCDKIDWSKVEEEIKKAYRSGHSFVGLVENDGAFVPVFKTKQDAYIGISADHDGSCFVKPVMHKYLMDPTSKKSPLFWNIKSGDWIKESLIEGKVEEEETIRGFGPDAARAVPRLIQLMKIDIPDTAKMSAEMFNP